MFRATVRADERTDVPSTVTKLRADAERAGVASHEAALLARIMSDTLNDLVTRGQVMAASGSQVSVQRTMAGEGYEVRLAFGAGRPRSLLRRLFHAISGR